MENTYRSLVHLKTSFLEALEHVENFKKFYKDIEGTNQYKVALEKYENRLKFYGEKIRTFGSEEPIFKVTCLKPDYGVCYFSGITKKDLEDFLVNYKNIELFEIERVKTGINI